MTTAIVFIVELVRHCWRHFFKIYYSLRSLSYEFMLVDDRTHFVSWIPFLNKIVFKPHAVIHTQRKPVSVTTHEQSIRHHQTRHNYGLFLISTQTGHGKHILAYTYFHDFRDELVHAYVRISVYTAYTSMCKYRLICMSMIKEQNERDICEVCINIICTIRTGMILFGLVLSCNWFFSRCVASSSSHVFHALVQF